MKLAFLSEKVYDKVTIRFYDVFFISNFKKRPDGKYEAVVSMSQKFTGEGDRPYSDVVQKNIQIILVPIQKPEGTYYEVKLGIFRSRIIIYNTLKILNLYKYILLVICGLQSVTLAAQGLDDDRAINNVLTMRVKMLDEFFQRFNGKYTVHAFQQENLDSVLLEKMATVMKDREMMIQFLVNQRNENWWKVRL